MIRYACILIFTLVCSAEVLALPRFALWRGEANCLGCHTNPTGGGIRNAGGEGFSKNVLAMWKRGDEFSGQISEGIRIGANIRSQYLSFSQSGPVGMPGDTTISSATSHAMTSALMVDAALTNTLHAYVRWDPINSYNEMYGILHVVDESGELWEAGSVVTNAYVKTGAFLPAFGIRYEDHTVYTRGGNRGIAGFGAAGMFWVDGYRDVGMEVGATLFDHVGIQIGYLNGAERSPMATVSFDNQQALSVRATASAEVIEDAFAFEVGGSMYTHGEVMPGKDLSLLGVHLGLRGGPVTLLAEFDFGENVFRHGDFSYVSEATALTAELAVKVVDGLDVIGRYEAYKDQQADSAGTLKDGNVVDSRITIGAQWFPLRFLEVRPEFRITKFSVPAGATRQEFDQNMLIIQTHFYF